MTWDYRIIKHDRKKPAYFAVHEAYYDENDRIENWTAEPVTVIGDTKAEVISTLQDILSDVKQPVLKESELLREL